MDQPISPVRFTGLFFARTMHSTTEIRNDVSEQVCVCVALRSAKPSARSVPPSLQELHGPEHEKTRGRRRNLERFQRQHGPID